LLLTGWRPRCCTGLQTQEREDLLDRRQVPLNRVMVEPALFV
jgi:hypothetical protein